jgi:hypothetical protein
MRTRPIFFALTLATTWLLQLGGSCSSDNTVVYRQDRYVAPPPPPPPAYYPSQSYPGRPPSPGYNVPNRFPRWAVLAKDDKGKIRWTADDSGTFYVYDVDKDFVRYQGPVRRGQEIIVQPGDDIVYVDGRAVSHENLRKDARHQVWFSSSRYSDNANRGDGDKTGGAGDPGRTIPKGASRLTSGRGDLAINAAPGRGTVYLYDEDNRNVIYTTDLDRGNSYKIDVSKGIIYVNSKRNADVKVPRGHTLSLYYK